MPLINFKQYNQQVQQNNNTILLVHGLFGSMDNLNMVARTLAKTHQVINIDVRNHGLSFHQNSMNYSELAQDIINLLNHLKINKTAILGHSMGGKIAMQVALDHSDRITKLIVADIAPVAYPAHHLTIIKGLKALHLDAINNRKEADEQFAKYENNVNVRQFLLRNLIKNKQGQFSFKCALNYISDCYPQIMMGYTGNNIYQGETLFIKGGNSDYIKVEHQTIIKELFPKSQVKIIANTGHWLHAEKTLIFNKLVNTFLESNLGNNKSV